MFIIMIIIYLFIYFLFPYAEWANGVGHSSKIGVHKCRRDFESSHRNRNHDNAYRYDRGKVQGTSPGINAGNIHER